MRRAKKTMLQKAKERPGRPRFWPIPDAEEVELALAWMRGEVTDAQACFAYKLKTQGSIGGKCARVLRRLVKLGRATITLRDAR